MNKNYLFVIILFFNLFIVSKVFALSNEFTLLLETMGVEEVNPEGLKINEDIYNEYNLLVYGSPHTNYVGQRWKNVSTGHWSKNIGPWNGTGIRGEYWILGVNYYGKEVHNHLFPVDIEPPTAPTEWRYAVISDALESWQDAEKYMDDVQREYMLSQNLTRNNIEYELNVMDIGLDKVRVENYATWKTKGSVYTQRYDMNNQKWAANFLIPPMAGDAQLESYAEFPNGLEYVIKEDATGIDIPITYGARVINLTDYAKKEHVKTLKSQLWINGSLIDEVEDIDVLEVEKDNVFEISKENYYGSSIVILNVEIRSTLITKFTTDGPLMDTENYTIFVYLNEKQLNENVSQYNNVTDENYANYPEIPPPNITKIEVKKIVDDTEQDLWIAKKTQKAFICAGQTITFKVTANNYPDIITIQFEGDNSIFTLDPLTKKFEWDEPKNRGEKTFVSSLKELNQMYDGKVSMEYFSSRGDEVTFVCSYIIPYGTKQTLHSWSTLREISEDAFTIKENKLFSRIQKPYEIVIKASGPTGMDTERIELDVFERWDTLYNRDLSSYIEN